MSSYRVILVEDNIDDETLALEALKMGGLGDAEIKVCRDGQEVVDLLLNHDKGSGSTGAELPQLVLLDLKLPKLNGFEVLKRLRVDRRTKLVPIVIFSSSNIESDIRECYEQGSNGFVRKPIDFSLFTDAVNQIASFWLRWNETASARREA